MPPGQPPSSLAVVHLVRRSNGVKPLRQFLDSYFQHPSGVAHDLVLVFKGFETALDAEYETVLQGLSYRSIFVADEGFDIVPYLKAARAFDYTYFCFLNSFSQILDDAWLAKLHAVAIKPDVGIAGATGSWDTVFAFHSVARKAAWNQLSSQHGIKWLRGMVRQIPELFTALWQWLYLGPFPSPHLRTNAFIIRRDRFLSACRGLQLKEKNDSYRFEHGRRSLTRRVARQGLRAVVVGRDGVEYEPDNWDHSNTFWQGDQINLLVGDNQTRRYAEGTDADRAILAHSAWYRLKDLTSSSLP